VSERAVLLIYMIRTVIIALVLLACPFRASATEYHELVKAGKLSELRQRLDGAPSLVNVLDNFGRTPLHYAAWGGHDSIVSYLIGLGANIEIADREKGWTPLFFSVLAHRQHVTPLLLKAGADLERRDNRGRTPVFELRSTEDIKFNQKLGAKFDIIDNEGETPLSFVCGYRAYDCATLYLKMGLDPNGDNRNGNPVSSAIRAYDTKLALLLLDQVRIQT
jgi:ankyrin repeat protein